VNSAIVATMLDVAGDDGRRGGAALGQVRVRMMQLNEVLHYVIEMSRRYLVA
jgi:hypothetical protein